MLYSVDEEQPVELAALLTADEYSSRVQEINTLLGVDLKLKQVLRVSLILTHIFNLGFLIYVIINLSSLNVLQNQVWIPVITVALVLAIVVLVILIKVTANNKTMIKLLPDLLLTFNAKDFQSSGLRWLLIEKEPTGCLKRTFTRKGFKKYSIEVTVGSQSSSEQPPDPVGLTIVQVMDFV